MHKIHINGIRTYGYHGCMKEEKKIGTEFITDVIIECEVKESFKTDDINDTVDYVVISQIVNEEINKTANLIELVAYNIIKKIKKIKHVKHCNVKLKKINAPIGLNVDSVTFEIYD